MNNAICQTLRDIYRWKYVNVEATLVTISGRHREQLIKYDYVTDTNHILHSILQSFASSTIDHSPVIRPFDAIRNEQLRASLQT
jgi:hypothetical protein